MVTTPTVDAKMTGRCRGNGLIAQRETALEWNLNQFIQDGLISDGQLLVRGNKIIHRMVFHFKSEHGITAANKKNNLIIRKTHCNIFDKITECVFG